MANVNFGKRLANKVAVVTASTDGYALKTICHHRFLSLNSVFCSKIFRIGFAIAHRFAAEGAKVVISSRKPDNVNKALDRLKQSGFTDVIGIKCHVAQENDRKQLLEAAVNSYGKIDIFVSNAAVNPTVGSVLDCPEEAWDKIFDVNVKAAYLLAKDVVPILKKQSSGSIIFVSSIAGLNPFPVGRAISQYFSDKLQLMHF